MIILIVYLFVSLKFSGVQGPCFSMSSAALAADAKYFNIDCNQHKRPRKKRVRTGRNKLLLKGKLDFLLSI